MRIATCQIVFLFLSTAAAAAETLDGERLALAHCGRCHVIGDVNKFGGIGSTPSFPVLRAYPDWKARFEAFYTEPPHIAVTQIEGVTEPFTASLPPPIHPVVLTEAEVEAIMGFVAQMEPKDIWGGARPHRR